MFTVFCQKKIKYDGSQIAPHWAFKKFNLLGDSIVAFIGPCNIPFSRMIDLQDVQERSKIYSNLMLHFIIEHFDCGLELAIHRQRLFAQIILDGLVERTKKSFIRRGDDIYDGKYKLSISVASLSLVSAKIHFGINIDSRRTPVPARGLNDYRIAARPFAEDAMKRYKEELESIRVARYKVRQIL